MRNSLQMLDATFLPRLRVMLTSSLRLPVTYRDLAIALGLRPPRQIARVAALLEALMHEDVTARRAMFAAVVVGRQGDGLPRPGFFECAVALGRFPADSRWHRRFHQTEWLGVHEPVFNAYRQARYRVRTADGELALQIDCPNAALVGLSESDSAGCGAFVTACNPGSRLCSDADNTRRMALLRTQASRTGLPVLDAEADDPSGRWPGEPGLFLVGCDLEQAVVLGYAAGQNAVVWVDAVGCPRLVETRTPP